MTNEAVWYIDWQDLGGEHSPPTDCVVVISVNLHGFGVGKERICVTEMFEQEAQERKLGKTI